ncbi:MAG: tetratricopeptide repeat protein [Planctomycetes bacterium]|nr:tetratricopeptide repeat protein [Planctomycetota bacterium]
MERHAEPEGWAALNRRWAPWCLAAVAAALYANAMHSAFVFDDHICVLPPLKESHALWPPWESFYGYPFADSFDRPVTSYTHALSYALSGKESWGFHAVSLVVQILAGWTLFGLTRAILRLEPLRARYAEAADGIAFAVALIWIVHPIGTVCTVYIAQRGQSLMALFFMLTLYASLRGFESARPWPWYGAAVVACLLGMGSKQDMAAAPLAVLLLDVVLVSGSPRAALRARPGLYVGLASTWIVLSYLIFFGRMANDVELMSQFLYSRWEFARTQFGNIWMYLQIAVWPSGTSFQHFRPVASGIGGIWVPAAGILSLALLALWGAWKRRWWGVLGLWCFLVMGPSSSIMPTGEIADERRFYLPLAFLLIVAVSGAWSLVERWRLHRRWSLGVLRMASALCITVLALAYATATYRRNTLFDHEVKLWRSVVANYPNHPLAHFHLGATLEREGRRMEAMACYRRALEIDPDHMSSHACLGTLLLEDGHVEEAWFHLSKTLAMPVTWRSPTMRLRSSAALLALGRAEEAEEQARIGTELDPKVAELWNNRGLACLMLSRLDEAAEHLERALLVAPNLAEAHGQLGRVRARQGRLEEALNHFDEAMRLRPSLYWVQEGMADVRNILIVRQATLHAKKGWEHCLQSDYETGMRELFLALRLVPNHPDALHYLAVMKRKAEEDFMHGEADDPKVLSAVTLLASALAIEGEYEDAAKFGLTALKQAQADRNADQIKFWEARLAGYARGEAYPTTELALGAALVKP